MSNFFKYLQWQAISYTVGFVSRKRLVSTEAQIGRAFLRSRKRGFSTQLCLTELSDWGIQSKNLTFLTGSASRKTQSKKVYTGLFIPSHRSSHHKTHTHTPTQSYQVPHSSIFQERRRCLGYHCSCFSPQVSVAPSELRSQAACITRHQYRALPMPFCQRRLRLL